MSRFGLFLISLLVGTSSWAIDPEPFYLLTGVTMIRCVPVQEEQMDCTLHLELNEIKVNMLEKNGVADRLFGNWSDSRTSDSMIFNMRLEADKDITTGAYHMHVHVAEKSLPEPLMFGTHFSQAGRVPNISITTPIMIFAKDSYLVFGFIVAKKDEPPPSLESIKAQVQTQTSRKIRWIKT